MKTKLLPVVCAMLCSSLAGAAFASGPCYTVYGKDNAVVYRSEEPPIDLSASIHSGMAKRFPNGHLVTQAGVNECPRVLPKGVQAGTSGFGLDDSPALKLNTPFISVQAANKSTTLAATRKRGRKSNAAPALAQAPQRMAAAQPEVQAADASAVQQVADGSSAVQPAAARMISYRRNDGRLVASYSRSSGGRGRR
ncbi:MAG: hypothetical protein ABJB17_08560 [Burkholderiales bacterium]